MKTHAHTTVLVEDDFDSRELLIRTIERCQRLELVGVFATAEDALNELPKCNPQIVLLDIKLPGMSGIECLRALREMRPQFDPRVIMLTGHANENLVLDALRAGAHGYLLKKNASSQELDAAVKDMLPGGASMNPSVARKVLAFFLRAQIPRPQSACKPAKSVDVLSIRQRQVLVLLNEGMMYKEIASKLNLSLDTTRKHVQSIYQKLHIHSRSEAMLECLVPRPSALLSHYTKM